VQTDQGDPAVAHGRVNDGTGMQCERHQDQPRPVQGQGIQYEEKAFHMVEISDSTLSLGSEDTKTSVCNYCRRISSLFDPAGKW
jgi:hypothetical protein